jgi:two-component system response regulator HydG
MTRPESLPEGASHADLLEATLSQIVDGVVVVDLQGRVQVLNSAAEQILGVPFRNIPKERWSSHFGIHGPDGLTLVPAENLPIVRALAGETVRDAEEVLRNEARPAGGRYSVSACPLRAEDGSVRGGISLFRDITERSAEEERRIRRFSALLELTRREVARPGDLLVGLDTIARGAAAALGVERVGIWRFGQDRNSLTCVARVDSAGTTVSGAETIVSEQFRQYFEALRSSTVVDAGDAVSDPRTRELTETYLRPLGIRALLDAPIFVRGELEGILCHEHRSAPRAWTPEEKTYAVAIANLAARAIGDSERTELADALRASEEARAQMEERGGTRFRMEGLVGRSAAMTEVYRRIRLAAASPVTVLLRGESGTGKERAAAAIHALSPRRRGPFIAINCSAIPEALLESELFGHAKGSFSGADRDRSGLFQAANGGTLFLDEIGELTPALQAKVLRALQEREVRRVGDDKAVKVDVRIITATNRNLEEAMSQGRMREDFYYRIRVFEIRLPPLRERQEDIPLLAAHFVREFSEETGKRIKVIAPMALRRLLDHSWPGNVRELRNAVEHAFVLASGTALQAADLPPQLGSVPGAAVPASGRKETAGDAAEAQRIRKALEQADGNRTAAAKALGISRVTLWHKVKRYGIEA